MKETLAYRIYGTFCGSRSVEQQMPRSGDENGLAYDTWNQ